MIVCEDSFADGIPETFRDRDRTAVPEEDAQQPAVNGMAINPEVCITDIAFRETIGKAPEERGEHGGCIVGIRFRALQQS